MLNLSLIKGTEIIVGGTGDWGIIVGGTGDWGIIPMRLSH